MTPFLHYLHHGDLLEMTSTYRLANPWRVVMVTSCDPAVVISRHKTRETAQRVAQRAYRRQRREHPGWRGIITPVDAGAWFETPYITEQEKAA